MHLSLSASFVLKSFPGWLMLLILPAVPVRPLRWILWACKEKQKKKRAKHNWLGWLIYHSGKFFYSEEFHSTEACAMLVSALMHTRDKMFLCWYKQEPTYHQTLRQRGMFSWNLHRVSLAQASAGTSGPYNLFSCCFQINKRGENTLWRDPLSISWK